MGCIRKGVLPCCHFVEMRSKTRFIMFACVAGSYQLDHMQGCCAHSWRQKRTPSKGSCRWAAHIVHVFKKQSCLFNHMSCISRQAVPQLKLRQCATNPQPASDMATSDAVCVTSCAAEHEHYSECIHDESTHVQVHLAGDCQVMRWLP